MTANEWDRFWKRLLSSRVNEACLWLSGITLAAGLVVLLAHAGNTGDDNRAGVPVAAEWDFESLLNFVYVAVAFWIWPVLNLATLTVRHATGHVFSELKGVASGRRRMKRAEAMVAELETRQTKMDELEKQTRAMESELDL